jgi:hypothetical protein
MVKEPELNKYYCFGETKTYFKIIDSWFASNFAFLAISGTIRSHCFAVYFSLA